MITTSSCPGCTPLSSVGHSETGASSLTPKTGVGEPKLFFREGLRRGQFAAVLRVHRCPIVFLVLSQGTERAWAPPFERFPALPRGPRSGPGHSVPVHHHLIDPIRPTRRHNSTSPPAAYTSCLRCASERKLQRLGDLRVVPCFRWQFCIDMSSSAIPGSSLAACARYLHQ